MGQTHVSASRRLQSTVMCCLLPSLFLDFVESRFASHEAFPKHPKPIHAILCLLFRCLHRYLVSVPARCALNGDTITTTTTIDTVALRPCSPYALTVCTLSAFHWSASFSVSGSRLVCLIHCALIHTALTRLIFHLRSGNDSLARGMLGGGAGISNPESLDQSLDSY